MGISLIRQQSTEITAPRTGAFPSPMRTRMGFTRQYKDPIAEKIELAEQIGSPDIDNSGRGCLRVRNHQNAIFDPYLSAEENAENDAKQRMTSAELYYYEFCGLSEDVAASRAYEATKDLSGYEDLYDYRDYYPQVPYDCYAGESFAGKNGEIHTNIYGADGELLYVDTPFSCQFPKAGGAGSTHEAGTPEHIEELATLGVAMNDDLIDADQQFAIEYNIQADGTVTKRSEEDQSLQTALARIDNQYTKLPYQLDMIDRIVAEVSREGLASNDPKFTTAAGSPVAQPDASPTTDFAAAASPVSSPAAQTKSVVFRTDYVDPKKLLTGQVAPASTDAQNDDFFLATGTNGTIPAPAPKI